MVKHRIDFPENIEGILELKALEVVHCIYKAQLLTYYKAMDKSDGLLLLFNIAKLKDSNTLNHLRGHRGEVNSLCNIININGFSVCSVVNFYNKVVEPRSQT